MEPIEKPLEADSGHAQDSSSKTQSVWRTRHDKRQKTPETSAKPAIYISFASKLQDAMAKGGLTSSEVARRMWGTSTDKRGYETARNRDSLKHYLAGTRCPDPENLIRLADAIGVPAEELSVDLPTVKNPFAPTVRQQHLSGTISAASAASGALSLTSLPAQPSKIRLQVDRVIDWELAQTIHEMLKKAEIGAAANTDPLNPRRGEIVAGADAAGSTGR